jgi:O-acetyl-ADP-ribose deacetylase (regulator of RNase III)
MLKRAKGNLLDLAEAGMFDCIIQGCNCWNTMSGGLAKEIRERYPDVAGVDARTLRGDYTKLGNWTQWDVWLDDEDGDIDTSAPSYFTVINAYTQYNMSTGQDVFEYTAFELILQKLAHQYPKSRIGLPMIGMGLARGDPNRIIPMLEKFAEKIASTGGSVTLVEFKQ